MCREVIINGTIWCDDHTDVYVGSPDKVRNLVQSQNHPKTATLREIQADCCDYLYFVCWSNDSGENGFIAQLDGDVRITTGNPHWQVYATSSDKDFANTRPLEKEVNSFIKKAEKIGVEYNEEQYLLSKNQLIKVLQGLIARDLWDMSEYYETVNIDDPLLLRAIEVISDSNIYNSILKNN